MSSLLFVYFTLDAIYIQLVNFDTWSRIVGTTLRSSLIDHIYVKSPEIVSCVLHSRPCFGDHDLITLQLCLAKPPPKISVGRNWSKYSPISLCSKLSHVDWSSKATDVQGLWNDFETKLINLIDELVPLTEYKNNLAVRAPFPRIKSKLNLRKRLIKNFKRSPTLNIKHPIKNLNYEIKVHFYSEKRTNVRKNIL